MQKDKLQQYTARITQANPSQLVVITYELIIDSLEEAAVLCGHDEKGFKGEINRARKLIHNLMSSLDLKLHISHELLRLYQFADRQLVDVSWKGSTEELDGVKKVIKSLKKGFEGVAKEDTSGPVMSNTQQLYAGLTYGKKDLNEVFVNINEENRGFKA